VARFVLLLAALFVMAVIVLSLIGATLKQGSSEIRNETQKSKQVNQSSTAGKPAIEEDQF